ncbi:alpha/beta hydrolase family protein [Solimonas marina]|uniref:S9 family peptidase n=1 Tax=Solimonas marina TaxID=2714601 RepID=A0A970B7S7_9GAMM|nr:prolyl oligopeptidase family serine peptidase [Solimonas marina]NKF24005.1 S9 family peptidase [Solimonas marina]
MKTTFFLFFVLAFPAVVHAAPVPLSDFARTDSFDDVQISPNGRYLAMRMPIGKDFGIAIVDLSGKTRGTKVNVGADRSVVDYQWASDDRLVFSIGENFGFADAPWMTGELFAINADGKAGRYIYGFRGSTIEIGTRIGTATQSNGSAYLVRTLPDDPGHVIIAAYDFVANADRVRAVAMKLDVFNGKREPLVSAPITGGVQFVADRQGFVRFVVGEDDKGYTVTYARSPDHPDWRVLGRGEKKFTVLPEGFSNDDRYVFLLSDEKTPLQCLIREDLQTGEQQQLSCDANFDAERVVRAADDGDPVGVLYRGDRPRFDVLDPGSPDGHTLEALQTAFAGSIAIPVSSTRDGSRTVVEVYSDKDPGDFYLFDNKTKHADFLVGARQWIDPRQMAARQPISLKARDGTVLHGYLTLPIGGGKHLPLVVVPHGGPFGIADHWRWDEDAQLLANHGYAVLQINFRGSGGFGSAFENAGRHGWDSVMIDDIVDATHWAVNQGDADAQRVCIYGASYGGYAALMSAERAPDLYRCAVGYAGVYDLPKLADDSDIGETSSGEGFIAEFIGDNRADLTAASPVEHVDKLKAALLIVHGTADKRAPFSQAESLRDALDKRHYPYEWMAVTGEGHGFYKPEDRQAFFAKLIGFLDHNIGPDAPAATADPGGQ